MHVYIHVHTHAGIGFVYGVRKVYKGSYTLYVRVRHSEADRGFRDRGLGLRA